jgi:hypothetical protein
MYTTIAGGADLFIWNQPQIPTIRAPYPPYIRSSCSWDNWWVHEASQVRGNVIDVTRHMTLGHIDHDYFLSDQSVTSVDFQKTSSQSRWSQGVFDDWRIYHNNVIARDEAYQRGFYTGLGAVKHIKSFLDSNGQIYRRNVTEESSAYSKSLKFPIISPSNVVAKGVPSLATLLQGMSKTEPILVTGVTFGYIDMLMNWICVLRRLNMDHNFVIAAFDRDAFRFLYIQGLPVFFSGGEAQNTATAGGSAAFEYGQQSFKEATKLKIASVKTILELGYDVIWSDSDIIFFKDFRDALKVSRHNIIMQSNNPIPKYEGYLTQRINSGFYFIRSTAATIKIVNDVIAHSKMSKLSEQMSFDAILCPYSNEDFCTTNSNDLVTFFDYRKFPNGAVLSYWDDLMMNETKPPDAFILHNNWIKGYIAKKNRIIKSKFWFWDSQRHVCRASAHCNCDSGQDQKIL